MKCWIFSFFLIFVPASVVAEPILGFDLGTGHQLADPGFVGQVAIRPGYSLQTHSALYIVPELRGAVTRIALSKAQIADAFWFGDLRAGGRVGLSTNPTPGKPHITSGLYAHAGYAFFTSVENSQTNSEFDAGLGYDAGVFVQIQGVTVDSFFLGLHIGYDMNELESTSSEEIIGGVVFES